MDDDTLRYGLLKVKQQRPFAVKEHMIICEMVSRKLIEPKRDQEGTLRFFLTESGEAFLRGDPYWHDANEEPREPGWYLCRALDDRWDGETQYRMWNPETGWWIPLAGGGWLSSNMGIYEWQGPFGDPDGPAPDETESKPAESPCATA